jgi:hypothetical protein
MCDAAAFGGLVYVAVLPTLAAMCMFGSGVERVGSVQAGHFTHLVPLSAACSRPRCSARRCGPVTASPFLLVAGGAVVSCSRHDRVLTSRLPGAGEALRE